jgi:hypothetical protein
MITDALAACSKIKSRQFGPERNSTIGASEIGTCARKVFFAKKIGTPAIDPDFTGSEGAAFRGTLYERHFWTPAMRARFGDKLLFAGDDQKTFSGSLSATPDGLLVDMPRDALTAFGIADIGEGKCVVVEGKTIDPRVRLDGPKPEHGIQAIVQIGLIRENTPFKPAFALISYINASFPDDVTEYVVAWDAVAFENAKLRANTILAAANANELKPEGWIAGGNECGHCPFTKVCGRHQHAVPTEPPPGPLDPQFVAEIVDLAREAKARRDLMEAAVSDLREAEEHLKNRLRAHAVRKVTSDSVSVTWSEVKGRSSFDMVGIKEAAAAAGIDLTEFELTSDPTDRLSIRITNLGTNRN